MKKILFVLSFLVSAVCYGQTIPGYTPVNDRYIHEGLAPKGFHVPAGTTPALRTGQWPRRGALYYDSTGSDSGLYVYSGIWHKLGRSIESNQIDVFLISGQSNAVGNSGSPSLAPTPLTGTAFQFYNNAVSAAVEPIGNSNGSAWPAFAVTYFKLTGRKICFVPAAVNGASMASAANVGYGTWDTTGTLYATSVLKVDSALTALTAAGYTPIFKGVLWSQGETDADGINRGTISQATYSAAFAKLIKNYRVQFGKHISVNISRTGFRTDTIQTGYLQVQAAQVTLANPDSLTNIVFWNAPFFVQRSMHTDNYHYNQPANNEMGRTMAENYVNSSSNNFQYQAGNVYYKKGFVGIGDIIPTSPLHIYKTGTARGVYLYDSLNDAVRMEIVNVNNGALAGSGIRLHNSLGLRAHMVLLSQASSLESDALWIFNNGNVLLGSDNGILNFYTGGTATPLNAKLRIVAAGNIGIGNSVTPHASAQLDVQSTTRGIRIPTMTGAQMTAISSPATGLLVYNTDSISICHYNGSAWLKLGSAAGGGSQSWDQVMTVSPDINDSYVSNFNNETWNLQSISDLTVHSDAGSTARLKLSPSESELFAPNGADGFKATNDSTYEIGLGISNDTTTYKIKTVNPVTGADAYANWNNAGGSSGWGLAGNAAVAGTDFIGTTNNVSWRWRTNNTYRGGIDSVGGFNFGNVGRITSYDGGTVSMIRVKQATNGIYGTTYYSASNDATGLSIGAPGIATDQDFQLIALGGDAYANVQRFRFGDNGAGTAKVDIAAASGGGANSASFKIAPGTLETVIRSGLVEHSAGGWYLSNNALNRLGTSGLVAKSSTVVSNNGTSLTTLSAYPAKVNTLGATNETINFEINGTVDGTGTVEFDLVFEGTNIFNEPAQTLNTSGWKIWGSITRTGASTATAIVSYFSNTVAITNFTTRLTGLTFSNVLDLNLEATSTDATADAVTMEMTRAYWEPAAAN